MSKLKQIIRLRGDGVALQTIARAVDISRNTVKKYLRLIEIRELSSEVLLHMSDEQLDALLADPGPDEEQRLAALSSLFPYMEKELRRTGVTRWILWGEYKQKHPDGFSYSRFCDHFKQYRISQGVSLRFEYKPGDKLFKLAAYYRSIAFYLAGHLTANDSLPQKISTTHPFRLKIKLLA